MSETPKPPREPRPSPINGPAFLVFGIVFVVLSFSTTVRVLVWPGIVFVLIGFLGIWLQRRYEKAAGIEEVLPGGRPKDER